MVTQIRAFVIASLVVASALSPQASAGKSGSRFAPGRLAITPEEAAIVADPDAGIERGVILVKRWSRNERHPGAVIESLHKRAKILSNEGRDLANVEVPLPVGARLQHWWGHTLLPDGTVLELRREDLERTTVVRGRGIKIETLKAALPGVVPGCVIDFGWSVKSAGIGRYRRVRIQTDWPIRAFHYAWRPPMYARAAYRLYSVGDVDVRAAVQDREIVITGRDLPPVADERLMPAADLVRASVVLYHLPADVGIDGYWDVIAREYWKTIHSLTASKKQRRRIVDAMELPSDGTAEQKMRAAYEWVQQNLTRTDVRTFEEIEAAEGRDARFRKLLADVIQNREGSPLALQLVLLAVAEDVGAGGQVVLASDRTSRLFDRHLRSLSQVDATFAAVSLTKDTAWILDPGSGLEFGDIPWWYSGSVALMATEGGAKYVGLPFLGPGNSGTRIDVDLEVLDDDELFAAEWTETLFGQEVLDERFDLRQLAPEDRQERLGDLCGAGFGRDVFEAQADGLDDLSGDLVLRCAAELPLSLLGGRDRRRLDWRGPWLREPPELPDALRIHPIVFDFPRSDTLVISVQAPEGFAADAAPPAQRFESDYGRYSLEIDVEESGYRIERRLIVSSTNVPPEEYVALREFFERVRRADRTVVEFRRGAAP